MFFLWFAVNVLLSLDETYADIMPVQTATNSKSAFVYVTEWAHLIWIYSHIYLEFCCHLFAVI